jgi:outer membrane protein assembly factor BamB
MADGVVYLSYPGGVAALNASTGSILWKARDASTLDPSGQSLLAVREGIIYSWSDISIVARSAQDGGVLWSQDVGPLSPPILSEPPAALS